MTINNATRPNPPLNSQLSTALLSRGPAATPAALTNKNITRKNLPKAKNKNMQNEPNLNISKIAIKPCYTKRYLGLDTWYRGKNEPKTNPNEANSKPIQTHFKPDSKPFKPKQKSDRSLLWIHNNSVIFWTQSLDKRKENDNLSGRIL